MVTPQLEGRAHLTKTPLFYWLVALTIKLFKSTAEWVVRVPSALGAAGCLIAMYFLGRILMPDANLPAVYLPLILGTMLLFRYCARLGELDMLMTCFSTSALLFFW